MSFPLLNLFAMAAGPEGAASGAMHFPLLHDLAIVMLVAGITTILCHQFKQPVALGYILAGFIVGPHTPSVILVHDQEVVNSLGELGVVLLMFSLGLEFSLRKLTKVGLAALIAALMEIGLMIWIGYEIGVHGFGWKPIDAIFLGAMLSISSTTIIVKALAELGKTREKFAEIIFGILVIEDILAIVLLALLSGIAKTGVVEVHAMELGFELGKLSVFFAMVLVAGFIGVPRLFDYISKFKSNELTLVTALALCFAVALIATMLEYSVALGAFLIGAVIAEARQIHKIEELVAPVRDMFSAIFFVTIGMLIIPKMLVEFAWPIAILSVVVILGKVATCSLGVFVGGKDMRTALCVGMGLAQIGEFSFIIAKMGSDSHVTSDFLYPIAVAVSVVTTLATPYLIKGTDPVVNKVEKSLPKRFLDGLGVYTTWIGTFGQGAANPLALLVQQMAMRLFIGLLLIIGFFFLGYQVGKLDTWYLPESIRSDEFHDNLVWMGVMIITSPIYLASVRHIMSMKPLIGAMFIPYTSLNPKSASVRLIIGQVFMIVSFTAMITITILLSTTILDSLHYMIPLLILGTLVSLLLRPFLVRVYSKAELALHETLVELPRLRALEPKKKLPPMLDDAELDTVEIPVGSNMIEKKLRDIHLRTQTGVSIVALERNGLRMINPGPDEVLLAGDRVLLIGAADQMTNAKDYLYATA